ncbi:aquaporin-like [Sycon ciliatum]|uniref:aquaporin-like n=1 Tax=Sycon ciliatum TaxID=27933 RepID=UPI0031F617F8
MAQVRTGTSRSFAATDPYNNQLLGSDGTVPQNHALRDTCALVAQDQDRSDLRPQTYGSMDHSASGQHYHREGRGDSGQSHGGTGRDVRGWALLRACLAELLATMLLVCLGVLGSRQFSVAVDGWVLLAVMCITHRVSDGHLNPAVLLGVWLAGEMSLVRLALYTMCQYIGGLVGAALALVFTSDTFSHVATFGSSSCLSKPVGIAVSPSGTVYVSNMDKHCITMF